MDEKRKEQLKQYSLDSSSFENLDNRLKFNETISGFYERLFDEEKMDKYLFCYMGITLFVVSV